MDKKTLKILTPLQIKVLDQLFAEAVFRDNFYLTGGTALSGFYLHHRYSDDLDFFTHTGQMEFLWPMVQRVLRPTPADVATRTPDFLRLRLKEGLQVDFVRDVPFRVGVPKVTGKWIVDNRENIAVNKVTAILGRLDPKDYVDLYFLLKEDPSQIMKLMDLAAKKDASLDPFVWSRIIADVSTIKTLPRMIASVDIKDLKKFFLDLQEHILTKIKPVL